MHGLGLNRLLRRPYRRLSRLRRRQRRSSLLVEWQLGWRRYKIRLWRDQLSLPHWWRRSLRWRILERQCWRRQYRIRVVRGCTRQQLFDISVCWNQRLYFLPYSRRTKGWQSLSHHWWWRLPSAQLEWGETPQSGRAYRKCGDNAWSFLGRCRPER